MATRLEPVHNQIPLYSAPLKYHAVSLITAVALGSLSYWGAARFGMALTLGVTPVILGSVAAGATAYLITLYVCKALSAPDLPPSKPFQEPELSDTNRTPPSQTPIPTSPLPPSFDTTVKKQLGLLVCSRAVPTLDWGQSRLLVIQVPVMKAKGTGVDVLLNDLDQLVAQSVQVDHQLSSDVFFMEIRSFLIDTILKFGQDSEMFRRESSAQAFGWIGQVKHLTAEANQKTGVEAGNAGKLRLIEYWEHKARVWQAWELGRWTYLARNFLERPVFPDRTLAAAHLREGFNGCVQESEKIRQPLVLQVKGAADTLLAGGRKVSQALKKAETPFLETFNRLHRQSGEDTTFLTIPESERHIDVRSFAIPFCSSWENLCGEVYQKALRVYHQEWSRIANIQTNLTSFLGICTTIQTHFNRQSEQTQIVTKNRLVYEERIVKMLCYLHTEAAKIEILASSLEAVADLLTGDTQIPDFTEFNDLEGELPPAGKVKQEMKTQLAKFALDIRQKAQSTRDSYRYLMNSFEGRPQEGGLLSYLTAPFSTQETLYDVLSRFRATLDNGGQAPNLWDKASEVASKAVAVIPPTYADERWNGRSGIRPQQPQQPAPHETEDGGEIL